MESEGAEQAMVKSSNYCSLRHSFAGDLDFWVFEDGQG